MSAPHATSGPTPWALPSGGTLVHGLFWAGAMTPVLLIHHPDDAVDLDCWADLPEVLQEAGHAVLAIDLPGCGLSPGDDDPPRQEAAVEVATHTLTARGGGPVALVTDRAGIERIPQTLLDETMFCAIVALSPPGVVPAATSLIPKLSIVGTLDPTAREAARRFLHGSRGWSLSSSFGTRAQGVALLADDVGPRVAAQIVTFLRDYRRPWPGGAERDDSAT